MKALLTISLLLLLGCNSAAQAQPEPSSTRHATSQAEMATQPAQAVVELKAMERIDQLEARVTELETKMDSIVTEVSVSPELVARLNALHWTEQDAIAVVQYQLAASLVHCSDPQGYPLGSCSTTFDPVYRALSNPSVPPLWRHFVAKNITQGAGQWSAVYEPSFLRWRVVATLVMQEVTPRVVFYVYERTGLVEGDVQP